VAPALRQAVEIEIAPPWKLPERDLQVATAPGVQHEVEPLGELGRVEPALDVMPAERLRGPFAFGIADSRHRASIVARLDCPVRDATVRFSVPQAQVTGSRRRRRVPS